MKGKTAVGCSDYKGCGFKVPFEILGKKLSEKQLQDLILKNKTSKLKGFTGEQEEGVLIINEDFSISIK